MRDRELQRLAEEPEILTVSEAARFLRMGRNQLYEAIGRNEIPHRRIGRTIRLSRSALVRWLDRGVSRTERDASKAR